MSNSRKFNEHCSLINDQETLSYTYFVTAVFIHVAKTVSIQKINIIIHFISHDKNTQILGSITLHLFKLQRSRDFINHSSEKLFLQFGHLQLQCY